MKTISEGLYEVWLQDKLKSYSKQSDRDYSELKRLRAEYDQLQKTLDLAINKYYEAGRDREVLIAKVQALRSYASSKPKIVDCSALQKKYDDLLADVKKLVELQSRYMAFFNVDSKMDYTCFKITFKKKHGL